jgi:gamma-glutamyltranspeptidase/glutathione hydrolase
LQKFPLKKWGFNHDSTVQVVVEAERRVYADRSKYLGDPDFYKVPVDSLLKPAYIDSRMQNFNWAAATPSSYHSARQLCWLRKRPNHPLFHC